ncbi:MAG: hypothetical protein K6B75_06015, partial [Lachnospiraceae bacterium]|nr:hypothetical protein [Lachnospiraceae bacterium]
FVGKVTSVEGNTITLSVLNMDMSNMGMQMGGERPEMGQMPTDGERPEMGQMPADGEMPEMGQMPTDGEMPETGRTPGMGGFGGMGRMNAAGGQMAEESGITATIILEDASLLTDADGNGIDISTLSEDVYLTVYLSIDGSLESISLTQLFR